MEKNQLIVIVYAFVWVSYIYTAIIKAKLHLEYLKLVCPDKYEKDENLFSAFTVGFNLSIQCLVFPFFVREKEKENIRNQALSKKIIKMMVLNCVLLLLLLLPLFLGLLGARIHLQ